ncbi:MAG TPA: SET domain-containing protein-lysine N-methyltransferase [Acidiferrobacteraceae bacterium]|nr:SET domain-containing protein-lysine N-methyltransferase [Acidiferrobacteraceae bacterium]
MQYKRVRLQREACALFLSPERCLVTLDFPCSDLVEVRCSPQHGRGVFARTEIPAGTRILPFQGPRLRLAELDPTDYHLQIGEEEYLGASGAADDYVNHSCTPNCALDDHLWLYALRPVAAGVELTWDYSSAIDEADFGGFPCHCGSPECRGSVRSYRHLAAAERARLQPLLLPYLRRKYGGLSV